MKNKKHYGEENDLNLKVVIGISRANQAIQKQSAVTFKEGGLTTAQFAVLEALYHKGTLTIQEIIKSILSTGGNMTVVINNLEKEELIERHVNPEDKRSSLIEITQKGKKIIEEIFPNHLQSLKEEFKVLTIEEKQDLITILKKLSTR
ncbi:MarR family transcriptional regulator [Anaerocolumna aminovalerica]|uniref:DNA-binding transcriptional regulator, MarR family n=1 Tax=Anaerocolumna aminovalerica TaxID=1527 RepID=A0A1I5FXI6_9FIRM|nr:MarR family transcriptional regulator [Anaerocolumna aminovalerica]MBU5330847.1 MarR family transcriptional regulator [Anaerocolumna aminovalerica]SFO28462.1 DNA-binding transcriptional regulator, MarR family [Anaerocolumna aminovalerica]